MSSSWKGESESPSRQLLWELGLHTVDQDRKVQSRLDQITLERERLHKLALEAAAIEHGRIIESAARAQERLQLQTERERLRLESEEKEALERERKEQVEQEIAHAQREILEARRLEERRIAAAEARAQIEEEERLRVERLKEAEEEAKRAALRKRQDEEEQARLTQEKVKREEEAAKNARSFRPAVTTQTQQPSQYTATPTSNFQANTADREAIHKSYVSLHRQLKEMRKLVMSKAAENPPIKKRLGEMRREIKKSVGQLTEGRGANTKPLNTITALLKEASNMHNLTLDVRPYIVSQSVPEVDAAAAQFPLALIYLLNMFAKFILSQFIDEAGVAPKIADPIGVVAMSIFASDEFKWQGISLIDILLAKFHVVCPVLFGIYGSDKTENGRRRLGWKRDAETGTWVSEQRHGERMTGLGSGFAAISLRDFRRSTKSNPFPPDNYWQALARIVNTPANEVSDTHYLVLKAMLEFYVPKIINFFGSAGLVAIETAVIDFPKKLPTSVASSAVSTLPATLRRDLNLTLPISK